MATKKKSWFSDVKIKKAKKAPKEEVIEVKEEVVEEPKEPTTTPEAIGNPIESVIEDEAWRVIGDIGGTVVRQPKWRIRFEAQVAPVPMFKMPPEIRRYLVSHWLTTDVYKRDKEWLEKHNVDPVMVKKLKDFLTGER